MTRLPWKWDRASRRWSLPELAELGLRIYLDRNESGWTVVLADDERDLETIALAFGDFYAHKALAGVLWRRLLTVGRDLAARVPS